MLLRYPKATALVAAILISAGLPAACSTGSSPESTSEAAVAAVRPTAGVVALVGAQEFAATLAEGEATVIDVRTPQEFDAGHIEGATNVDLENQPAFTTQVAALDPSQTYAVYCRSGNRSAMATAYLVGNGFTSVIELDGGIMAWQEAGLPLAG